MKITVEQIKREGEAKRKKQQEKEARALLKFAKQVFQSATSNGKQLPEEQILRAVAEAANSACPVSTRFAADLKISGVDHA